MAARRPSRIGAHVPVGAGLIRGALPYAERIGAQALQVFVSNPRGWAATAGDPAVDERFRAACTDSGHPVFIHAPYLVNLASPSETTRTRSVAALAHALRRGRELGAAGVVVHAGSAVHGERREAALSQLREALLPVLDDHAAAVGGPQVRLLIEPTAGGGQALAATVDDLGPYLETLDGHPLLGVCLDTCHLHAAGHDLAGASEVRRVLNRFLKVVGPGRLGLVHANDSRDPAGSARDRHANIGSGTIPGAAFAELLRHPATRGVPVVVETPGDEAGHARDLAALRALRDAT